MRSGSRSGVRLSGDHRAILRIKLVLILLVVFAKSCKSAKTQACFFNTVEFSIALSHVTRERSFEYVVFKLVLSTFVESSKKTRETV